MFEIIDLKKTEFHQKSKIFIYNILTSNLFDRYTIYIYILGYYCDDCIMVLVFISFSSCFREIRKWRIFIIIFIKSVASLMFL